MKTLGIILIILGILTFVYKGVTYRTDEKVADVGPIEVEKEKTNTIPLSPVVGGVALAAGIALVALAGRRSL
ncbi:MAG: DUF3185 domain-containing protein [Deltaproteobacteria bacterium]|nr:DUF3185 domain-containing protein [Deltaproteobacteria bacterium]